MNGIVNVYKEKGFTSFDVCAKLRRILSTKKIGHTGTLDPDAEGVLPVCVGNATKLCDLLTDKDKIYEAVLYLGVSTDTEDMTGTVLETRPITAGKEEVLAVINQFVGTYDQIPPMYSAIKVNGQRLYDMARKGQVIERQARTVTIHSIDVLDVQEESESGAVREVRMTVACSKGTYIRSLCRDIGDKLGCGGCMKSLLRTKVSKFLLSNSLRLGEIEELVNAGKADEILMPVDAMFTHLAKALAIKEFDKFLYNGNILSKDMLAFEGEQPECNKDFEIRVYDSLGVFTGIYEYRVEEDRYKPVKMFL